MADLTHFRGVPRRQEAGHWATAAFFVVAPPLGCLWACVRWFECLTCCLIVVLKGIFFRGILWAGTVVEPLRWHITTWSFQMTAPRFSVFLDVWHWCFFALPASNMSSVYVQIHFYYLLFQSVLFSAPRVEAFEPLSVCESGFCRPEPVLLAMVVNFGILFCGEMVPLSPINVPASWKKWSAYLSRTHHSDTSSCDCVR